MGREEKISKTRRCRICQERIYGTSEELLRHMESCRDFHDENGRLAALGLVRPQMTLEAAEVSRQQMIAQKDKRLKPRWS